MKIDIISGFLGAGKTTLIKKLIEEELFKENIAIIENEYGEVGIDGKILKNEDVKVKEITSGCICCTIMGDFKNAIKDIIKEYKPTRIIIEPSGVAKLSEILKQIRDMKIKINIQAVVIDVLNFELYINNFGEFYTNQILNAKTILLSRSQLISSNKISYILKAIKKINPKCSIITTPWEEISAKRILEVGENKIKNLEKEVDLLKKPLNNTHLIKNYINKEDSNVNDIFQNWGEETAKIFTKNEIQEILKKINSTKDLGFVVRAKGIVQVENNKWIKFDYVPNEIRIAQASTDYTGRICVIGNNLKEDKIKSLFLDKTKSK